MNLVFDFGAVLFTWQPAVLLGKHLAHRSATAEAANELAQPCSAISTAASFQATCSW